MASYLLQAECHTLPKRIAPPRAAPCTAHAENRDRIFVLDMEISLHRLVNTSWPHEGGIPFHRILALLGFLAGLGLWLAPSWAGVEPLTESQVIGLFYARNLSILSAELGLETAQAQK